jgi:hypothetical protein
VWQIEDFTSKVDILVDRLRVPGLSEVKCNITLPCKHFAISGILASFANFLQWEMAYSIKA